MAPKTTAYLGLGANLGDPVQQLVDAREALRGVSGVQAVRCSSMYISSPVGDNDQPSFINCVVELMTDRSAISLLDEMQMLENKLGRVRVVGNQNAPRLIDIDLLIYGEQHIQSERLIVPHPRLHERLFVLQPLLELCADEHYADVLATGHSTGLFETQELFRLAIQ